MALSENVTGTFDSREQRVLWQKLLLAGANELRPGLQVDEGMVRWLARQAHSHGRDYFLYSVLDEVQRAAVAIMRWAHFLGDDGDRPMSENPECPPQMTRVILESMRDEQSLRVRKLLEALVNLINFSDAGNDSYFRHYLLLLDLDEVRSRHSDLVHFWNCDNLNLRHQADQLAETITALEDPGEIDLRLAWYRAPGLARGATGVAGAGPGRILSSTRQRLQRALPRATAGEKSVLRWSYLHYSDASKDLHFAPAPAGQPLTLDEIALVTTDCALAGLHVLERARLLLGATPGRAGQMIAESLNDVAAPQRILESHTRGAAEQGDFVLAYGFLAEVLEVLENSTYGYRSFRVRFLVERPLPEIEEDSFPAASVEVLFPRAGLDDQLADALRRAMPPGEGRDQVLARIPGRADEALRETVIDLWTKYGLREHVRDKLAASRANALAPGGP